MLPLFYLSSCLSTNDEIINYLNSKLDEAAIYTHNQTKGRGQYANEWLCGSGKNLAYSFAVKENKRFTSDFHFGLQCCVAFRESLEEITQTAIEIKWPNDFILNQKKISGMIIEKKKIMNNTYFVVGIGVNVLQKKFDGLKSAGSILSQTGISLDLNQMSTAFHLKFFKKFQNTISIKTLLENFNEHLFRRNNISVFELDQRTQNGIIQNMDEQGNLLINLEKDGLKSFKNKEITMLY